MGLNDELKAKISFHFNRKSQKKNKIFFLFRKCASFFIEQNKINMLRALQNKSNKHRHVINGLHNRSPETYFYVCNN